MAAMDNGIKVCGAVRLATTAVAAHQQLATYIGLEIERGRDNEASRHPPSLSLIMSSDQEVITVNLLEHEDTIPGRSSGEQGSMSINSGRFDNTTIITK